MKLKLLITSTLLAIAVFLSGCHHAPANQKQETKRIKLSPDEELKLRHLLQAAADAQQEFQPLAQKYERQAESDTEFRDARDKAKSSAEAFERISQKYNTMAEADPQFRIARDKAKATSEAAQNHANQLFAAKNCRDCKLAKDSDYSYVLTNAKQDPQK